MIYINKKDNQNMSDIEIFSMTVNDLEIIKDELQEKFDKFWTYGIVKSEIVNINSKYIVAKYKEEIVGFAGITIILDESNIMNIVVKKEKRMKGIGKLLLQKLIEISQELSTRFITLEVNINNKPAINLYKKFGFKEVGIRKKYYNSIDDALIMTKEFEK